MTLRRAISVLVVALVLGLVVGVAYSGDDLVSVEVWIATSATTIIVAQIRGFLRASAVDGPTITPAWRLIVTEQSNDEPTGVRVLRSVISSSLLDPRSHNRHLEPHLVGLAEHYLPRRHGLDMTRDREPVMTLLGDVYWLVDPTVADRAPTADELARFLTIVVGDDEVPTAAPRQHGATVT